MFSKKDRNVLLAYLNSLNKKFNRNELNDNDSNEKINENFTFHKEFVILQLQNEHPEYTNEQLDNLAIQQMSSDISRMQKIYEKVSKKNKKNKSLKKLKQSFN